VDWEAHAVRGAARYQDGVVRLPDEPKRRERQLVRMAMAAGTVGLARVMQDEDGTEWFRRSSAAYRESFALAPPGSWGRVVGAVKAGILSGSPRVDAEWALEQLSGAESCTARYAKILALLALGLDEIPSLGDPEFPADVAAALDALGARDALAYRDAAASVLASFESRQEFLENLPVADTVLVLELLASQRGIAAGFSSALLPRRAGRSGT
jgi:hypothetical protein